MKHISTEIVNKIINKINRGEKLKRSESIFYQGQIGILNNKLPFLYTINEAIEVGRCYNDPIYFIENYCFKKCPIKGISKIILRDYQKNWINNHLENKFNIYINSRQVGFSIVKSMLNLWEMIFHKKQVLFISNKMDTSVEHLDNIKMIYINLPYFLKQPIIKWERKCIKFSNDGYIKAMTTNKLTIGQNYDIIDIFEAFHIKNETQLLIQKSIIPVISSLKESKLSLSGQPIGNGPLYSLTNSDSFKVTRTYWWQVPGRDENWKENEIKAIGSEELFDREYNLIFKSMN